MVVNFTVFARVTVHANWSTVEKYAKAIWIVLTGYTREQLFKMIQSDSLMKIITTSADLMRPSVVWARGEMFANGECTHQKKGCT